MDRPGAPRRVGLIALLVMGCEGGSGGLGTLVEVENTGGACLFGHEPAGSLRTTFVADQPVEISVGGFACLSSSCTIDQLATCEARVEGSVITITSHASWIDTTHRTGICTDDCTGPSGDCATPPLPAGTYSVRLAEHTAELVVPSMTDAVPCLGDGL